MTVQPARPDEAQAHAQAQEETQAQLEAHAQLEAQEEWWELPPDRCVVLLWDRCVVLLWDRYVLPEWREPPEWTTGT